LLKIDHLFKLSIPLPATCLLKSTSRQAVPKTANSPDMSTSFVYEKLPSSQVSTTMLAEAASLFSSAYGVWGPLAEERMGAFAKQGMSILKMLKSRN
jgi:hypothetical protein